MNAKPDYKYDVAISFLQEDESIARTLCDLLSERLKIFFYCDRQKEIAGTDGEVTFNNVFRHEARIVIVLYRAQWGTTPWTRIEQTAIRNRGYDDGYGFVILIPLEKNPAVPAWLPKTSIWVGLDRWGVESAAAVIEARVQESGGVPREETPQEQANRVNLQKQEEKKRQNLINSEEGVRMANAEVASLFLDLEKYATDLTQAESEIKFGCKREPTTINFFAAGYHVYISWVLAYCTTLHQSSLEIRLSKVERFMHIRNEAPPILARDEYVFDVRPPVQFGWRHRKDNRFFSSGQLATRCVKQLLKFIQEEKPPAAE
jgi:hypothetical protein